MQMPQVSGYSTELNAMVREVRMEVCDDADDGAGVSGDGERVAAACAGGSARKIERMSSACENDDAVAGDGEEDHPCGDGV